MSKSLGNLVTIRDALSQVGPVALRLYLLSSHYRSSLSYSSEGLAAQARALGRLREAAAQAGKAGGETLDAAPFRERFLSAMDDDLNTPQAIAALFDLAREINRLAPEDDDVAEAQETLRELAGVLGLSLEPDLRRSGGSGAVLGPTGGGAPGAARRSAVRDGRPPPRPPAGPGSVAGGHAPGHAMEASGRG